ncbi:type II toxin-antitoxin system VapC family toxin [Sphingomonas aracearum]|uniref:Type II toxin-antitoxin system VapC family toxin n=2 Tax=Sphingomonas aracearum TaxID=2283317 RepID=A0A369VYI8_9SPHN|nr:type II toxin-antitoxin system VapC family toxin [Sphingomonas aracearum]
MVEGDAKLGHQARLLIDRERESGSVSIAAISLWETAMLVDKNKIALSAPVHEWFEFVFASEGFELAPISVNIGVDAGSLPGDIHGDPADRLIVATARALARPVLTVDRKILGYAANGHVQAIDARR